MTERQQLLENPAAAVPHPAAEPEAPWVLLIHGTAAGDPNDVGEKWWQCESGFWRALNGQLAPDAVCGPAHAVFHWSGANSERARRQAGLALYRWLLKIDDMGRPYHIVAHSHGGSVLWHAMLESVAARRPLRLVETWTTVGTPFLSYAGDRRALMLLVPWIAAVLALTASWNHFKVLTQTWSAMIAEHAGGSIVSILMLWSLIALVFVLGAVQLVRTTFSFLHNRRRESLAAMAWESYGAKWFGVWSSEDEAINGLTNTLGFRGDIVPRAPAWGVSAAGRVGSFLTAPFRWMYNKVLAPLGDQFIWDRVTRRVQGSDVAAARLVEVSRGPVASARPRALPQSVNHELRALADAEMAKALAAMRQDLGAGAADPDLPGLLARFQRQISWNELVHNSYFNIASVRDLLARRVREPHVSEPGSNVPSAVATRRGPSPLLMNSAVAGALIAVVGAAHFISGTVYNSSVATFRDEYQVEQAITTAPLAETVEASGEELLGDWIAALAAVRRWDEVVNAGARYDAALAPAVTYLFEAGRPELVRGLLQRREIRKADRVPDCSLADSVGELLSRGHPAQAQGVVDILRERKRGGVPAEAKCYGNGTSSAGDALTSAEALVARDAAGRGAPLADVIRRCVAIAPGQQRQEAFDNIAKDYLEKKQAANAYALLKAAPKGTYIGDELELKLAGVLRSDGKLTESDELANLAIAAQNPPQPRRMASKLAGAGLPERALAMLGSASDASVDNWLELARDLTSKGELTAAEEAVAHVPPDHRSIYPEGIILEAVRRHDFARAQRLLPGTKMYLLSELPAAFAEAGMIDDAIRMARMSDALWQLGKVFEKAATPAHRAAVADAILKAAGSATPYQRLEALPAVIAFKAKSQSVAPLVDQLVASARDAQPYASEQPWERRRTYIAAAQALLDAGDFTHALDVYRFAPAKRSEPYELSSAVDGKEHTEDAQIFVDAFVKAGRLADALRWCGETSEPPEPCGIGSTLSVAARAQALAQASAMRAAGRGSDAAQYLLRCGLREDAMKVILAIAPSTRDPMLDEVCNDFVAAGNADGALWAAAMIGSKETQDRTFTTIAKGFTGKNNAAAFTAANAINDPGNRIEALLKAAGAEEQHDDTTARAMLAAALPVAQKITAEDDRMKYVCGIAVQLARRGEYRKALQMAAPCPSYVKLLVDTMIVQTYAKNNHGGR